MQPTGNAIRQWDRARWSRARLTSSDVRQFVRVLGYFAVFAAFFGYLQMGEPDGGAFVFVSALLLGALLVVEQVAKWASAAHTRATSDDS
ncbi:hypothetical protein [Candidatus Poriferisodalis sp.]|uniref:hypothetical protein n=1 Tax=Candidatus Poriferisodalis sp. TaxID=3101277 RepID=UPI003B01695D